MTASSTSGLQTALYSQLPAVRSNFEVLWAEWWAELVQVQYVPPMIGRYACLTNLVPLLPTQGAIPGNLAWWYFTVRDIPQVEPMSEGSERVSATRTARKLFSHLQTRIKKYLTHTTLRWGENIANLDYRNLQIRVREDCAYQINVEIRCCVHVPVQTSVLDCMLE